MFKLAMSKIQTSFYPNFKQSVPSQSALLPAIVQAPQTLRAEPQEMETFHSPYEEPREPNISSDNPYTYTRSVSSDQSSDQEETYTEPINYQELST